MNQEKYKTILKTTSEGGQDFYFAVADEISGALVFIFHQDPATLGEDAEADAVVHLVVETDEDKTIRVIAHLWDDLTPKEELATRLMTLIEGKNEVVKKYYHTLGTDGRSKAEEIARRLQALGYTSEVIQTARIEWVAQLQTDHRIEGGEKQKLGKLALEVDAELLINFTNPCESW